jgi:hypothetical protein
MHVAGRASWPSSFSTTQSSGAAASIADLLAEHLSGASARMPCIERPRALD